MRTRFASYKLKFGSKWNCIAVCSPNSWSLLLAPCCWRLFNQLIDMKNEQLFQTTFSMIWVLIVIWLSMAGGRHHHYFCPWGFLPWFSDFVRFDDDFFVLHWKNREYRDRRQWIDSNAGWLPLWRFYNISLAFWLMARKQTNNPTTNTILHLKLKSRAKMVERRFP